MRPTKPPYEIHRSVTDSFAHITLDDTHDPNNGDITLFITIDPAKDVTAPAALVMRGFNPDSPLDGRATTTRTFLNRDQLVELATHILRNLPPT